jgi:phosphomannomutase
LALITSISGIRGTIGGRPGENLTPVDVVNFAAAYGSLLQQQGRSDTIVIGRDARPSGEMVQQLVMHTLSAMGFTLIDLGLSTTPTVEMAVPLADAAGGIILTASHNPMQWNALKLLNAEGEFISKAEGEKLLEGIRKQNFVFQLVDNLGRIEQGGDFLDQHIQAILALELVEVEAIRKKGFKVAVDPVNSSGAIAVPALLEQLGCETVLINGTPDGQFAHNPEPLPAHLTDLCDTVKSVGAQLGIAVDPDVDRLAFVQEDGAFFGEEYTLVAAADYVLSRQSGDAVSNLSSSRALRDITRRHGDRYHASAVGEVNVVEKMKDVHAVIGGEGNGGVILPDLHYGRDALVGIALVLSHLATSGQTLSELRRSYPHYEMIKDKIALDPALDLDGLLRELEGAFSGAQLDRTDGLKADFEHGWLHLRKSNTEPIIRIYAEASSAEEAHGLVHRAKEQVQQTLA